MTTDPTHQEETSSRPMDMERLVARLDGRINALQCLAVLPPTPGLHVVDQARKTGVVWLRWVQFQIPIEAPVEDFLLAFEALELLALLAHVAYDQWLGLIKATWPLATTRWVNALYPSKFELGVAVPVTRVGELTTWAERAFAREVTFANGDGIEPYETVREDFAALLTQNENKTQIRVQFVLGEQMYDSYEVDSYSLLLFEAVQLARTQVVRKTESWYKPRWDPLFLLVGVQGDAFLTDLTLEDVLCVDELAACGVRVPFIIASAMALREVPRAIQGITLLRRTILSPAKHGFGAVDGVVIDHHADDQTLDGIFSAVLHSTTVREVLVDFPSDDDYRPGGHARLMEWLALCVFGRYGCPSLDTFTMRGLNLQMSDVQALERALQGDDALCTIFPNVMRFSDDPIMVATASKFVLVRPPDQDGLPAPHVTVSSTPLENLRVLKFHTAGITVLLPGWGHAYVSNFNACLEQKPAISDASQQRSQPVRRLLFHAVPADRLDIFIELVRVMGPSIKTICIGWDEHPPVTSNWIRRLCLACPNVEAIELQVQDLNSLDVLASCYKEGVCRAQRLVVVVDGIELEAPAECMFFNSLAEKTHAMTHHLRELAVNVHTVHRSSCLKQLAATGLNMLQHNHVLSSFDMQIKDVGEGGENSRSERIKAGYARHSDQPVTVRVAPLRIELKTAFLIAVISSPEHSARSRVDPSVIGRIFEFAAECKKRHAQLVAF